MDQKTSHYGQLFLTLGINFKTPNNVGMHSQIVFFCLRGLTTYKY